MSKFTQLDEGMRVLFDAAILELGSKQNLADKIGVSRTAISLIMSGKYAADVDVVVQKFRTAYNTPVACPHLSKNIAEAQCKTLRLRPFATPSRAYMLQCLACRDCAFNPHALEKGIAA